MPIWMSFRASAMLTEISLCFPYSFYASVFRTFFQAGAPQNNFLHAEKSYMHKGLQVTKKAVSNTLRLFEYCQSLDKFSEIFSGFEILLGILNF